jgi:hypothetical protein
VSTKAPDDDEAGRVDVEVLEEVEEGVVQLAPDPIRPRISMVPMKKATKTDSR